MAQVAHKVDEQAPETVLIAEVMGLSRADSFTPLKLVDAVARGVPANTASAVARRLDPEGAHLSAFDFVPKTTLNRCISARKPLSKDASEQLYQVARVFVEARRHYGNDRATMDFLMRPHALLEGRTPFALAKDTVAGAELVIRLLGEAEAGLPV